MSIKISNRLSQLTGYAFAEVDREVEKLKKLGITPIDFRVGDPKEPTPEVVRDSEASPGLIVTTEHGKKISEQFGDTEGFKQVVAGVRKTESLDSKLPPRKTVEEIIASLANASPAEKIQALNSILNREQVTINGQPVPREAFNASSSIGARHTVVVVEAVNHPSAKQQ